MTSIVDNWPFERIVPNEDDAVYDLLMTMENELDHIDVQADELMEQRFIDTATTFELQKLASEVGVQRQTGESTEQFRFRTRLSKAIERSSGTVPKFAQILKLIFGEDTSQIDIEAIDGEPATRLYVPQTLIDDIPVTAYTLEEKLLPAIPTGDRLEIVTGDMLILGENGSQGLGKGELS